MKNKKRFWRGFWYGFIVTAVILAAVGVAVYGMAVAEQNTRAVGFGDAGGARVFSVHHRQSVQGPLGRTEIR